MILPSFTKILSSDPDFSIFHDLVKKHGLIHNVKDVIFVPTNDAFKYLFPRVTDKEYELKEFLEMAITENVMKAHVSRFREPLHVMEGIQTSTGLIVKTNEVKFFTSWDPEDKWRYLAHRMNTLRFGVYGIKTFDQCHMTFRLFAEKKEIDKLFRLGVDSGKFHEATGMMMEQLSSMHEKSSEDFVDNSIYKSIAKSKELPNIKSWYRLNGRLSDPVLTNLVPRIHINAEKVFMTFLTPDMSFGMNTLFTNQVSLEDSLSVLLELVFRDEHAWTDIVIKFDIYYIVYGMIMDHLHETPKTWIELGIAGTSSRMHAPHLYFLKRFTRRTWSHLESNPSVSELSLLNLIAKAVF
jgi:hypothetical protein